MPNLAGSTIQAQSAPGKISLPRAADLAQISYDGTRHSHIRSHISRVIDENDVQAYLLKNGLLLIPGSNSALDYLRFNFRLLNIGGKRFKVRNGKTGEALGAVWHQGFLAHAMLIHEKIKDTPPKFIIGHSLGAAAAQILSLLWQVPAIGFAAPRIYAGGSSILNNKKCLCLWRADDPVGNLPSTRFRHAGKSLRLSAARSNNLLNHHMRHYRAALSDPNQKGILPAIWPIV